MSGDRNTRESHAIKIDNISFGRVKQFRYLGTTLKKQNYIQEEIKSRPKKMNACYHPVQNLLYSRLLYKNTKITVYRNIILPLVMNGCEIWSLTLREERRRSVYENRVLRRIFGPKKDEVTGEWKKLHNEELNDLLLTKYYSGNQLEMAGYIARMRRGKVYIWFR